MRMIVMVIAVMAVLAPCSFAFEIFELNDGPGRAYDPSWPPDGSPWHQIQPPDQFCIDKPQTDHDDQDGDGQIDVCENVQIDGVWKHIEWVGPTIAISPVGGGDVLLVEPVDGRQMELHIIHPPEFACLIVPYTGTIEQPCDIIIVESGEFAGEWHVDEINTNIHTNGGSPVEPSTWTRIKQFFAELFD